MISVCMITYNHEKYIRQSIEGVLAQEVSYPFELMIFNDASTDDTDLVIRDLIQHHPKGNLIKYAVHEKNIGLSPNYIWSIRNCTGKYVAICEGDDYWTDIKKLQKQIDLLEKNSEYSFCFHQALRIDMVNDQYSVYPLNDKAIFNAADFFAMTTIPMASVVFRNSIPLHFVKEHLQLDFILLCNLLSHGKAFFFREVMSVYRVHSNAFTSQRGTLPYMKKRIEDIYEATGLRAFSEEVRKQIARVYMVHVLYMIAQYKSKISRSERILHFLRFLRVKRPNRIYWPYYGSLVKSILN
jgi:glycosyltransferase involved in cell wall biosynthesis